MFTNLKYMNPEQTIISATRDDGTQKAIEPHEPDLWKMAIGGTFGEIEAYVPPPPPTRAQKLAAERAGMDCTNVQMKLALHRMGALEAASLAVNTNPEAAIIWASAGRIFRRGPVLEALKTAFSDARIDKFFRAAAEVTI